MLGAAEGREGSTWRWKSKRLGNAGLLGHLTRGAGGTWTSGRAGLLCLSHCSLYKSVVTYISPPKARSLSEFFQAVRGTGQSFLLSLGVLKTSTLG